MEKEIQRENKMGTMPVTKLILTMSLPAIFSMTILAMYNVVDSIFVARLSEDALTAVSLAMPIQNIMIALAVGTGVGVAAGFVPFPPSPCSSSGGSWSSGTVSITGDVWLRTGPGLDYDEITNIGKGATATYLGNSSVDGRGVTWYKIQYKSHTGWVSSRFAKIN